MDCLPSPKQVSLKRIEKLMSSGVQVFDNYPPETKALAESIVITVRRATESFLICS